MLFVINPAPTRRAHESATCPTTSTRLNRPDLKLDDPRPSSLRLALTSVRAICTDGAEPATSAVSAVMTTTNPRIGRSTANSM